MTQIGLDLDYLCSGALFVLRFWRRWSALLT